MVARTIASTLEIIERANRPILKTLCEALSLKNVLLILDNCEHVIDVSAQTAERLLSECLPLFRLGPGCHAISTRRGWDRRLGRGIRLRWLLFPIGRLDLGRCGRRSDR